jgi:Skp family chaperone for outer membrane proteins
MTTIRLPKGQISIDVKTTSSADLVKFYNAHSGSSKVIQKFSDRETAERRVKDLIKAHNELAAGTSKASALKKKEKESKKMSSENTEKASRGRTSSAEGKHIHKVGEWKKTNPRREGTHGHKSWEAIKDGMSYEEFLASGGRNRDLMHDVKLGRIEIR